MRAAHLLALTKRRAVDFCRVATAICPANLLLRRH